MKSIRHLWNFSKRSLIHLVRQPQILIDSIVGPILWLFIFGNVFYNMKFVPEFPYKDYITFMSVSILGIMIMDITMLRPINIIMERLDGFYKKLLVFPIKRHTIFLGSAANLLPKVILPMILILVVVWITNIGIASGIGGMLIIFGLCIVASLGFLFFGILFTMITKGEGDFYGVSCLFKIPFLFMTYLFYPKNFTPDWLQYLARFNPLTYVVETSRNLIIYPGFNVEEILTSFVVLALFSLGSFFITYFIYTRCSRN